MEQQQVKASAEALQAELDRYSAVNAGVAALRDALEPYIQQALSGLQTPFSWNEIPGSRTFQDTDLRNLPGLEDAYAVFKFAVTGGEPDWLKSFRQTQGS